MSILRPRPNEFEAFENHTSAQTNNELVAAPPSSNANEDKCHYVTGLIISNGAVAGTIFLVEDTGGTPVQISQTFYVGINGGAVAINFPSPIKVSAGKNLGFTSATVTTHSIHVFGYTDLG